MPGDDIQGLYGVVGDLVQVARQRLQEHLQADHGHPLQGDLKGLVLPLTRERHLQVHLMIRDKERRAQGDRCELPLFLMS